MIDARALAKLVDAAKRLKTQVTKLERLTDGMPWQIQMRAVVIGEEIDGLRLDLNDALQAVADARTIEH